MKKTLGILQSVFIWLLITAVVVMIIFTIVSTSTFNRADRNLFGYKAFIVLSNSMSKTDFDAGDLILVKKVELDSLKEGDIIAYQSTNAENYGETVTHKIRKLTTDAEGIKGFITFGTTTGIDDESIVTYPYVLGKYQAHIPKVGSFFQFLKTTPGYMLCIFLPFMLLIMVQLLRSIKLFRRYKAERVVGANSKQGQQDAELVLERERIEAERNELQKMITELKNLKEQLGDTKGIMESNTDTYISDGIKDASADTNG